MYLQGRLGLSLPLFTRGLPLGHSTSSQSNVLVFSGAEGAQCGVSSPGVVKALDVLEDRHLAICRLGHE